MKLQGVGNLRITLNGIGADKAEEFGVHLIRKPNIRFLPDKELLDRVKRTSLEKVARPRYEPDSGTGGGDGGDETPGA